MLLTRQRKRKKLSPGSGRHISDETFAALYKSYAENRDISQAAKDAGVSYKVAKKYIEQGTEHLPAIAERVTDLDNRTIGILEADIMETRQNAMKIVQDVAQKLADSLNSVEVVLSSSRLFDEEGQERRTIDGKPIVPVDANGLRTVLQAVRDITDIMGAINGGKMPGTQTNQGPQVNVGVVLSPESVAAAAGKVMRQVVSSSSSKGAQVIEGQFKEVVTKEAVRRVEEADGTE